MRYLTLIFLVIVLPAAVYWAVNGMAGPADTWERFAGQVDDIRRSQPEPEPDPPTREPGEMETEEGPGEKPTGPPVVRPSPEEIAPRADPDALFAEGRFRESVAAYGNSGGRQRAIAELGAAFAAAFPRPTEPYVVVEIRGGSTQEGYAIADGEELSLLDPTGRAIAMPSAFIVSRRTVDDATAIERTVPRIEKEVASGDARRIFRATAAAFRIGRPDLAGPLLAKIIGADSTAVLKAITKDVSAEARDPLFRAYADAMVTTEARPEPIVAVKREPRPEHERDDERKNPLKLDGGSNKSPRNNKFTVTDAEAKRLMVEARPLRLEGNTLYDRISTDGIKKAKMEDVEAAIRKYEAALALYEQALEREDDDTIYVLVTGCSKKLFQLRFWKEQIAGR